MQKNGLNTPYPEDHEPVGSPSHEESTCKNTPPYILQKRDGGCIHHQDQILLESHLERAAHILGAVP